MSSEGISTRTDAKPDLGLALICNFDGLIIEVLWDDFALSDDLVGLSHFIAIFDPKSVQKGLSLFLYVKEHRVAFGWEINLTYRNRPVPFSFSAAAVDDRIVLLASSAGQDSSRIYDGLSGVINEQVNSIRSLSKQARSEPDATPASEDLPDQFSGEMIRDMLQLNNRLVNAERELARKNAELRRLSTVLSKDLYLAHRVLQCSGEAVVIADQNRRIVDVNQAFTTTTGFGKQEIIGTELMLCENSALEEGFVAQIWESVSTRGFWQGECSSRRKSGEPFPKWLSISTVPDENARASHYVVVFSDITRLKTAEEKWQRLAYYDSLTDLPNRVLFRDRLQQAILRAHRDNEALALLFIDLDDFKVVNDSVGHDAGDQLLREAAQRIASCTRETDSICRLGGDEFTVIVSGAHNEADIARVCDKLNTVFSTPFLLGDAEFHVGASIGVARYPYDGDDPDVLTKNADAAMYAAKSEGRNTSRFFSKTLGEEISTYVALRTSMTRGLANGEFLLYLQPEMNLRNGDVVSLEALVRWNHPERGMIGPDAFIPIAEESGVIVDLGEFVINEAIRLIRDLRNAGWPDLRIAINVSRRQLLMPGLPELISTRLTENDLPGSALIVEVTESMVMGNLDNVVHTLSRLKGHGVSAAIDDFGTGHSSLSLLRRLPVEFLKIDRSFVADADVSAEGESIVQAIAVMAKRLGLKIIAEGVERPEQEALLQQVGCDLAQGYWYAKPLPYEELLRFLNDRSKSSA
ncbi:MAG: EAL domain-containing protein [Thiohalocapsa sp.]|nr:EAL domain-containing protein [Thiohalocapsa sp.]